MPVTPARKRIVLTVHHVPRALGALREVLHTAVGLAAGPPAHQVAVILMGDGLVHGLREHGRPACLGYLKAARAHGVELFADQHGMMLRGFSEGQLLEGFTMLARERILWKLGLAEVHLRI